MGKSSLPCRNEGSKWIVTGRNGPSKVVGMAFPTTTISVIIKRMRSFLPELVSSIKETFLCFKLIITLKDVERSLCWPWRKGETN